MQQYKNTKSTALSVAVWLATDNYDYDERTNVISATTLIKPTKQIILGTRGSVSGTLEPEEVSNLVASRMGTAFHNGIESAWLTNYKEAMKKLGYPDRVINKILLNPSKEELFDGCIPIYLEIRSEKQIGPYIISGKFDFVGEGRVEDFKSTGTYTYTKNTNDEKYILQGSIYRWLNPDIITDDTMAIQFIFTDWSANKALSDKNYPQNRVLEKKLTLLSLAETEAYIRKKVNEIVTLMDAPEEDMPECTKEDLWQGNSVFKYYKNPAKTARSTANFDNYADAHSRYTKDGSVGIVKEVKGEAKACLYCNGFSNCKQKDALIAQGILKG